MKTKIPKIPSKTKKRLRIPFTKKQIDEIHEYRSEQLLFSFKFLNRDHEAFNLGGVEKDWYLTLIDHLKDISTINRNQLVVEKQQHYQAHELEWEKCEYCFDFDEKFLEQVDCLQFRLSSSSGRVHGFIIGNRFYIVWLDPHHNLYPDDRYGGVNFYNRPWTSYEVLKYDYDELLEKYNKLKEEYDCCYELLGKEREE